MVGEGKEGHRGLCGDLPAAERGGDILEGTDRGGEALGLPAIEEGLGDVKERPRCDEDVVRVVLGGAEVGGGLEETPHGARGDSGETAR